jgi:hypothetical protein
MLISKVNDLKQTLSTSQSLEKIIAILEYLSLCFGSREIGQGLDKKAIGDFIDLLVFSCDQTKMEKITTRALSILLYNDSKRLENLLSIFAPLLSRAQKNVFVPDFSFLDRSYPETMISGKIIFELTNSNTPLVNAEGLVLNLPLETIQVIAAIKPISEKPERKVLTIENKETFFALGSPQKNTPNNICDYDCYLYTGGYPNRAVVTLIKILTISGFTFYHAGDLDPDGILILQNIQDIAVSAGLEKPVLPIRMDAATFDQYRTWARPLTSSMLGQIKKIREETLNNRDLAELLQCIRDSSLGVEQEIVDYRGM